MTDLLLNTGISEMISAWNEFRKILPAHAPAGFEITLEKYISGAEKKLKKDLPALRKILKKSPTAKIQFCGALPVLCLEKGALGD